MLTILATSARVAPGLLSWQAWTALREASRVLAGPEGHPQVPALAEAGIAVEVLNDVSEASVGDGPGTLADVVAAAVAASAAGSVVWLAPAGAEAPPAELLAALARAGLAESEVRVMHGSRDLPGAHLIDVVTTMNTLRTSCPWDRRQTHESLAPHLLEEPYEALDALESGDHQALREELGDVLLQVVFHARIAADRAAADDGYTVDDVADTLVAKLVRRHPHVFANVPVDSAEDVNRNWEEIKKAERAAKLAASGSAGAAPYPSVLDSVAFGQPALSLAAQLVRRAARIGYPVAADTDAAEDSDVPGSDVPVSDVGEELLRLVAEAAQRGMDPELELRRVARRLADRVRAWERHQS